MTRPRRTRQDTCSRCRGVGQIPNPFPAEGYQDCPDGCTNGLVEVQEFAVDADTPTTQRPKGRRT